jgi:hypothetical protein
MGDVTICVTTLQRRINIHIMDGLHYEIYPILLPVCTTEIQYIVSTRMQNKFIT